MKITLINPPAPFLDNQTLFPNLGSLYLMASLKRYGYEADYVDMCFEEDITNIDSDIIGITATSPQVEIAAEIADDLRKIKKRCIILGGCGAYSAQKYKNKFDLILKGEGEERLPLLLDMLDKNQPYMQKSFQDILNMDTFATDINNIFYPDRNFLKDRYHYQIEDRKATTMITSRGCPFKCGFCMEGNSTKLRLRSVDNILGEIDEICNLGYRAIMFYDDVFTSNPSRVKEIGGYLKSKDIIYRCFTHVKFAKKVAKELAATGCKEVAIGIESGDDRILKIVNKGFTSSQALEVVKILKDCGLKVKTFLMIGLPGETKESIENTKEWLRKAQPHSYNYQIFSPFPGTDIWENKEKYDISWNGKVPANFYEAAIWTNELSSDEILQAKKDFDEEFPNILIN